MTDQKATIVLTGANGGLGSAIASKLVSTPGFAAFYGLYVVRDASKASHSHAVLSMDLTNLANVRKVAADINARVAAGEIPPIRALVLNAGWGEFASQTWTDDGFDIAFAANYLSHWLLTLLLLESMDRELGRIVVIGSVAHDPYAPQNNSVGQFNDDKWKPIFHDSTEPIAKGTWSTATDDPSWRAGFRRYAASKLCQLMMVGELQRRLDEDPVLKDISVLGVDPGTMNSPMMRRAPWILRVVVFQFMVGIVSGIFDYIWPHPLWRTTWRSAGDVVSAALDSGPGIGLRPKGLYFDGPKRAEMYAEARDPEKQLILWRDSVRYTSLKEGDSTLFNWK
ncbi:putative short-chain dehydrogenase [Thozetella sp. PMI_491]|nr:putative short-chain dehydrogenase [Thozetella sp. PMI_491]